MRSCQVQPRTASVGNPPRYLGCCCWVLCRNVICVGGAQARLAFSIAAAPAGDQTHDLLPRQPAPTTSRHAILAPAMTCQKCRQPLKLDGSLEDLNPAAYDLLVCERIPSQVRFVIWLTLHLYSFILATDAQEVTRTPSTSRPASRAIPEVPLRQNLQKCHRSHLQAQPGRQSARFRHVLHLPDRVADGRTANSSGRTPANTTQTPARELQQRR